ncbi:hypothetical protein B0H67DRAFT_555832 [Lasiosphaeris hirsuta]|uniref:Uncharacterized protein n=1 Tax=Lasiosphaeris hirsuta TaxID=260670 RepID=A0AA40A9Y8_9PEZI|nr:hypothetical protein B0H67DRAFT_555832 [Lasiosphaeris hirsuta]
MARKDRDLDRDRDRGLNTNTQCSPQQLLLLDSLPPELLANILDFLIPQPPEIGETRPVDYEKLVPGEPWFEFTRCRRGLWSLCLASRRYLALAQPLLYRTMAILDEDSMFLFFRTLTDRPDYGPWTRYLSCHLTLTRESVIRETRRAVGRLLRTFNAVTEPAILMDPIRSALSVMVCNLPVLSTRDGDFDEVPQVIMSFILMFLTRLETFLMQVPICDDHVEYTSLFVKLKAIRNHFAAYAADDPDGAAPHTPLQKISTLLLQGDPELLEHFEGDDCDCEVPEVWGLQPRRYAPVFECLPALTTLEVSTDDGAWVNLVEEHRSFLQGGSTYPYLRGIRHIYLHNSIACPRNLFHILLNAPDCQTLYMTPRRDDAFDRGDPGDSTHAHPEALDVALTLHARNLRHLDIAWFDAYGYESLIGSDGRLASLPGMEQLEKLCIQLAVLYGSAPAALETPLAELLPPNLVELTLEDWWWFNLDVYDEMEDWGPVHKLSHYRQQREYRANAIRMLTQFARDFRDRMPKLEKVLLLVKIPYTWMVEEGIPIGFHFEDVKAAFGLKGVEFLVDEI